MKKHILRWAILLTIGVVIGLSINYFKDQSELSGGVIAISPDNKSAATIIKRPSRTNIKTVNTGTSEIGGDFTLIDHNGQKVTQETYADKYKLIFFGFTFCPAVCPTELQKVNVIMDELGGISEKIIPIFVSIDPERDNAEVMKEYVAQFHPSLIGLTGSQEQIDVIKNAYKVYANKVENDMMDEYMMNHSAFLYLMSKDNKMIAMYPERDSAVKIAQDIKNRDL